MPYIRAAIPAALLALMLPTAQTQVPPILDGQATIMSEDPGWKLLQVTTTKTTSTGSAPLVWMVNKEGVDLLPVSDSQRAELKEDFKATASDGKTIMFVVKDIADSLEGTGTLPAGYEAAYADTSLKSCFGWDDKEKNYTKDFSEFGVDRTFNLSSYASGHLTANVPLSGQLNLNFKYRLKNSFCVPYKFKFRSARAWGHLTTTGQGDLSANAQLTGHWDDEWKLGEPELGDFTIWLGPVPVRIKITLPIHVGLSLDVNATGSLLVQPELGSSGTFDYTCTADSCSGSNQFSDDFNLQNADASAQIDLDAQVHLKVQGKVAIYDDRVAFVQGGIKGLARGELWGYLGNTCGDADGDGSNETVRGLAIDYLWGYDIVYGIGGFLLNDRDWTHTGPRYPLGWRDLLGNGGSTALQPMIEGPSQLAQGATANYTVRMRPCYPYAESVDFTLGPGTWSGATTIPAPRSALPAENSSTLWRSFPNAGPLTLSAVTTTDARGRSIQVPFNRTIQVISTQINAPSNLGATATSSSTARLTWIDNSSNETGFEIFRRLLPSGSFVSVGTRGANATLFDDTGLAASTSYEYRVRAYNTTTVSPWSPVAAVTTAQAPLGAPSGLAATYDAVARRINLAWTDNSSGETAFQVQFSYSGSAFADMSPPTVGAGVTAYTSGANPPVGSYAFRVRAIAGASSSPWSNTASLLVLPSAPEIRVVQAWDGVEIADGGAFTFPTTPVAQTPISRLFRICNDGNVPLNLLNPTTLVSGVGFTQIDVPPANPVQPGACSQFRVRFHVANPGSFSGAITIQNDDATENPFNVALAGTATP
jgi:hypothetical protein